MPSELRLRTEGRHEALQTCGFTHLRALGAESKFINSIQITGRRSRQAAWCCLPLQVLLYAEMRGNSQSLVKVVSGGVERAAGWRPSSVQHETTLSALLDGGGNFGILVMAHAMELATAKAKAHGFGLVGTNNTASGTGALG